MLDGAFDALARLVPAPARDGATGADDDAASDDDTDDYIGRNVGGMMFVANKVDLLRERRRAADADAGSDGGEGEGEVDAALRRLGGELRSRQPPSLSRGGADDPASASAAADADDAATMHAISCESGEGLGELLDALEACHVTPP